MFKTSFLFVSLLASNLLAFPTAFPDNPPSPSDAFCAEADCKTCKDNRVPRMLTSNEKFVCVEDSQDGCKDQLCSDCNEGFFLVGKNGGFWGCEKMNTENCADSKCQTCKPGFLMSGDHVNPCSRRLDFSIQVQVGGQCLAQKDSYFIPVSCTDRSALRFYDKGDSTLRLGSKDSNVCLGKKRVSKLWAALVDCNDFENAYKYVPKEPKLMEGSSPSIEVDFHPGNGINYLDWDDGYLHVVKSEKTVLQILLNFGPYF
ncbi:hypothetical protein ROZALSC1DRAFT_31424 [Rozella allomycis CSF55]|uniref:TNFR-Cys domain-containing protein n=1 Tax=Rozella allomycis (strain CSF55) TaxID=988480 RepID=A0A075B2J4_ROZAC|nr:hypothetical protein O9G_006011 [Rozella allomycis CSF55]RKP16698.1 hypothetical protein ROZALSC1DRAFT_31424 [Rozella allomycis CSF55]|eukprot:EPZ36772.1 hypothetical protein O9G_006011 [Rozella allomycis CSF55]